MVTPATGAAQSAPGSLPLCDECADSVLLSLEDAPEDDFFDHFTNYDNKNRRPVSPIKLTVK